MKRPTLLASAVLALAAAFAPAAMAQVVNGSFETGNLTGWTTGGTGQVAAVQNVNFRVGGAAAAMPNVPDGTWFAALSTGPGDRGGGGQIIDGNGFSDFDAATLTGTLSYTRRPAFLAFSWNFPSSEPDQGTPYDDIFDVTIQGTRVQGGSVTLSGAANSSNFTDAPAQNGSNVNWTINAAPIANTSLVRGVGAWQRSCIALPGSATSGTVSVTFRVADQRDAAVDSALLIDNVRLQDNCNDMGSLEQVTSTTGSTVETKTGGFVFRPATQRLIAASGTGAVLATVSSANLTGDNPNVLDQVFVQVAGAYTRITSLPISAGGTIQSLAISGDGGFLVVSARQTAADNLEIYRIARTAPFAVTAVTSTSGCDNTNAVVNGDGTMIAFESNCNAITTYGTTQKVVYWRSTAASTYRAIPAIAGCASRGAAISYNSAYIALESTCNQDDSRAGAAQNADLNYEVWRYLATGDATTAAASWRQATVTASPAVNFGPSLSNDGNELLFISNVSVTGSNNNDGVYEIFMMAGTTLSQVTNSTAAPLKHYIQVRQPAISTSTGYYTFERIDGTSFTMEVGAGRAFDGTVVAPATVVTGTVTLGVEAAEGSTDVLIPFISADSYPGTPASDNTDGNFEIWRGRINK